MLPHETIDLRPELWCKARINAKLSGVPLRDSINYVLVTSTAVDEGVGEQRAILEAQVRLNREARQAVGSSD